MKKVYKSVFREAKTRFKKRFIKIFKVNAIISVFVGIGCYREVLYFGSKTPLLDAILLLLWYLFTSTLLFTVIVSVIRLFFSDEDNVSYTSSQRSDDGFEEI